MLAWVRDFMRRRGWIYEITAQQRSSMVFTKPQPFGHVLVIDNVWGRDRYTLGLKHGLVIIWPDGKR